MSLDPLDVLRQLVETPSVSGNEADVSALAESLAVSAGLTVERIDRNLLIHVGEGGETLLLNSHLDTVPSGDSWGTDPWTLTQEGDRWIGLGANDAKGCVTAMLCAISRLAEDPPSGRVTLALTVEEETGGEGLEKLIHEIPAPTAAVIGEPTSLEICRAQKGLLVLEVDVAGDARHAAHAHRLSGRNAIREAATAILALNDLPPFPEHELLGPITCQVTTISGGTRRNVIADKCTFAADIRTTPVVETEEIITWVEKTTGCTVRVRSDRLKAFETGEDEKIVCAAKNARAEASVVGSATLSDAVWTRHLPTVKVGPGNTERSHTAGEYITIVELNDGVAFYEALVRSYFTGSES